MTLATSKVFHIPSSECDHAIAHHNIMLLTIQQLEAHIRLGNHISPNSLTHESIKEVLKLVHDIKFDIPN